MPDADETEVITTDTHKGGSDKAPGVSSGSSAGLSSQRTMVVALAVAVLAVVAAGVWWWQSRHSSYSDEQVADAKTKVCTQAAAVRQGVVTNTHLQNPVNDDPIGGLAVAANARLALSGGGAYLHDLLADTPATPSDLASAVGDMANTLEELGVSYLAGQPNEAQVPLRHSLDEQLKQLDDLCKQ